MPTLTLKLAPLQNPDRYAALARALTALTAQLLGKRPEVTAVAIQDMPVAQWFVGGTEPAGPAAMLDISITAGTNTVAEKGAFVAAVFEELQRQLAPHGRLHPASYVSVHELPATDWGYGGQTQRQRQLAREAAAALAAEAA
ncbi:MAG TPA: tautomerase family protein [Ramlibacter sp.]|nr:tautomerase family protein [Ramlibacter sp.]